MYLSEKFIAIIAPRMLYNLVIWESIKLSQFNVYMTIIPIPEAKNFSEYMAKISYSLRKNGIEIVRNIRDKHSGRCHLRCVMVCFRVLAPARIMLAV
jgi:hypothetical protein